MWDIPLRDWQEGALAHYLNITNPDVARNFLAYVTPGAGKTILALRVVSKTNTTQGNSQSVEYVWINPQADDLQRLPLFAAMKPWF